MDDHILKQIPNINTQRIVPELTIEICCGKSDFIIVNY